MSCPVTCTQPSFSSSHLAVLWQEKISFQPHPKTLTMAGELEYWAAQVGISLLLLAAMDADLPLRPEDAAPCLKERSPVNTPYGPEEAPDSDKPAVPQRMLPLKVLASSSTPCLTPKLIVMGWCCAGAVATAVRHL